MRRVVITGMSVACADCNTHEELFKNLCDKKIVLKELTKDTPSKQKVRLNYCVPFPEDNSGDFAEKLAVVKKEDRLFHICHHSALCVP